mmetsp:Transcript_113995/g.329303  ORF Transcript_113995/g.329303 Transcript_113995/m.329303 type:complete len:445 (+) Transcript_113995:46-1380(+)
MSEVICVHVGQAGVQLGGACWELFCLEHGIDPAGSAEDHDSGSEVLFSTTAAGKRVPRSTFIDLEQATVDQVRNGTHRELFHPDQLLSAKDDSSGNFGRGFYGIGKQVIDEVCENIRRLAEDCLTLQGLMIFHGAAGGCGAGFASILIESLKRDFGKVACVTQTVWPSEGQCSSVMAPYSAVLLLPTLMETADTCVLYSNTAMYDICSQRLGVEQPTFQNINRLVAQVTSSMLAPSRFDGSTRCNFGTFLSNTTPYPRMHFFAPSYAPFVPAGKVSAEQPSVGEMTVSVFEPSCSLLGPEAASEKLMSCWLLYRGDVQPGETVAPIGVMMRHLRFTDWVPSGLKHGVCYRAPAEVPGGDFAKMPRACCALSNSCGLGTVFSRTADLFDKMYSKRAFVHWLVSEMPEGQFSEARESLEAMRRDYEELAVDTMVDEGGEESEEEDH